MASDFEIEPGLTFGDWLYREIASAIPCETAGWPVEQVNRVSDRLQQNRTPQNRLTVVVPWFDDFNAFTAPGRYIYFSRHMLERCDDEMAAFVIAHEIAHHDLGHMTLFPHWVSRLRWMERVMGGYLFGLLFRSMEKQLYGPERESAADSHGLDHCIRAGYDPKRCISVFDQMEREALDFRDIEGVFGPDSMLQPLGGQKPGLGTKVSVWAWQQYRGYLPIRERKAALLASLQTANAGGSHG